MESLAVWSQASRLGRGEIDRIRVKSLNVSHVDQLFIAGENESIFIFRLGQWFPIFLQSGRPIAPDSHDADRFPQRQWIYELFFIFLQVEFSDIAVIVKGGVEETAIWKNGRVGLDIDTLGLGQRP